jgi:hypothetical protein
MKNVMKRKIPDIDFLEEGSPPSCCRLLSMLAESQEEADETDAARTSKIAGGTSTPKRAAETEFRSEHR